jgi:hypothetical protein
MMEEEKESREQDSWDGRLVARLLLKESVHYPNSGKLNSIHACDQTNHDMFHQSFSKLATD